MIKHLKNRCLLKLLCFIFMANQLLDAPHFACYKHEYIPLKGYNFENTRNKYYVIGTILKAILQGIC